MDLEKLAERLRRACVQSSLRKLAREFNVSHESLRKLMLSGARSNITSALYNKIDSGLRENGF